MEKLRVGRAGRQAIAVAVALLAFLIAASASLAAVTGTRDAATATAALDHTDGAVIGAEFEKTPPKGNPVATFDEGITVFPLAGNDATVLSTGDATIAGGPNAADDTGTDNGGGGGGHGKLANDLISLRVDLDIPADRNCLTFEFRFLTEEFNEFIGSDFNDAFLAEVDATDFKVNDDGTVEAPSNIAFGPDGGVVTVNSIGTSADNAIGTAYDGATPILRGSTPITAGDHSVYFSIYDAGDSIYDSAVLLDNLRLRNVDPTQCTRGSADNPNADDKCINKSPTIFASDGVATGTRGDDVIQGSDDDDLIRGKGGDDLICGGPGDDTVRGGGGADRIVGNTGDDELRGGGDKDRIDGKRGSDKIFGQAGGDRLKGAGKSDKIFGGGGGDFLSGGKDGDRLRGEGGSDRLNGDQGPDKLDGGAGKDQCDGGAGKDSSKRC